MYSNHSALKGWSRIILSNEPCTWVTTAEKGICEEKQNFYGDPKLHIPEHTQRNINIEKAWETSAHATKYNKTDNVRIA